MRTGLGILAAIAALSLAGCDAATDDDGSGGTGGGSGADLWALVQREQACTSAADCCVAIDGCMATAYVVAREDYEAAVAMAEEPRDMCVGCISPVVEVRCEAGACVGVELTDYESPEYTANQGSHCGEVAGEASQPLSADGAGTPPGRVFGCGVD